MLKRTFIGTVLVFVLSVVLFFVVRQYQRRTLGWIPVPIEIVSSEIAHFRKNGYGRVWTATVNYRFNGTDYTKTIDDLPLSVTEIYVDPGDPTNVVGQRGETIRALFIPIIAMVASGLLAFVLGLIKFSPVDD